MLAAIANFLMNLLPVRVKGGNLVPYSPVAPTISASRRFVILAFWRPQPRVRPKLSVNDHIASGRRQDEEPHERFPCGTPGCRRQHPPKVRGAGTSRRLLAEKQWHPSH